MKQNYKRIYQALHQAFKSPTNLTTLVRVERIMDQMQWDTKATKAPQQNN